jgi:hypothetical protein
MVALAALRIHAFDGLDANQRRMIEELPATP